MERFSETIAIVGKRKKEMPKIKSNEGNNKAKSIIKEKD